MWRKSISIAVKWHGIIALFTAVQLYDPAHYFLVNTAIYSSTESSVLNENQLKTEVSTVNKYMARNRFFHMEVMCHVKIGKGPCFKLSWMTPNFQGPCILHAGSHQHCPDKLISTMGKNFSEVIHMKYEGLQ